MNELLQDLRFGLRMLRKSPLFTSVAIAALALGIGATTLIFSIVNGVLLRPLPFPDADRLSMAFLKERESPFPHPMGGADFLAWRDHQQSYEHVAAYVIGSTSVSFSGVTPAKKVLGVSVTADFFTTLGIRPFRGRGFTSGEDNPGAQPVVVISNSFWREQFNSDPQIIGRTLILNGTPHEIVGLMGGGFAYPDIGPIAVWMPEILDTPQMRPPYFLAAFGRMKPGVSYQRAEAELNSIVNSVNEQFPNSGNVVGRVASMREWIAPGLKVALFVLLGAVSTVLLIALLDVANLLLVRASARVREVAMRVALGANRFRMVRQLLTESVLLAMLGGAAGLLLAFAGMHAFLAVVPGVAADMGGIPGLENVTIDFRVLAFTTLISIFSGILFGLAPAIQMARPQLTESLKENGPLSASPSRNILGKILVVSQFALALILTIGAGLLSRSFLMMRDARPGFKTDHLLTLQLSLADNKRYTDEVKVAAFWQQLLAKTQALPGVDSAAVTMGLPPNLLRLQNPFMTEGQEADSSRGQLAEETTISPGYFQTMGVPVLWGHAFTEADRADRPGSTRPVIINQTMAKQFYPNQDPTNKRMHTGDLDDSAPWEIVVGVVGDVKYSGLDARPSPTIYVPYTELGWTSFSRAMYLVVRTKVPPLSLVPQVRAQVESIDRDIPVSDINTMDQLMQGAMVQQKFRVALFFAFAGLALLLAMIGIYAVVSYTVSQRTREFGVRLALGASKSDIFSLMMRQAGYLAAAGLVVGNAGALLITRVLGSLLFHISPTDPTSFIATSLALSTVVLLASSVPSLRATKVDPLRALRYDG